MPQRPTNLTTTRVIRRETRPRCENWPQASKRYALRATAPSPVRSESPRLMFRRRDRRRDHLRFEKAGQHPQDQLELAVFLPERLLVDLSDARLGERFNKQNLVRDSVF